MFTRLRRVGGRSRLRRVNSWNWIVTDEGAGVAQLVERLICTTLSVSPDPFGAVEERWRFGGGSWGVLRRFARSHRAGQGEVEVRFVRTIARKSRSRGAAKSRSVGPSSGGGSVAVWWSGVRRSRSHFITQVELAQSEYSTHGRGYEMACSSWTGSRRARWGALRVLRARETHLRAARTPGQSLWKLFHNPPGRVMKQPREADRRW